MALQSNSGDFVRTGDLAAFAAISPSKGAFVIDNSLTPIHCTPGAWELLGIQKPANPSQTRESFPVELRELCAGVFHSKTPVEGRSLEYGDHSLCVYAAPFAMGESSCLVLCVERRDGPALLNEKLLHMDRLASLGTIGAMTAHEIRNAMVSVKTFVELLLQKSPDAEMSDLVRREIARVEELLAGVSQFAGSRRASAQQFDVNEVLDHACRLLRPQCRAKKTQLEQEIGPAPALVNGHSEQILQVFVNLLLNALEASGEKGVVTLKTRRIESPQQAVEVEITDNGVGITPEQLPNLFQPFFTTKPAGTGLGLFITRRVVEDHKGRVAVDSSPGQGTSFRVILPLAG